MRKGQKCGPETLLRIRAAVARRDFTGVKNPNWRGGKVKMQGRTLVYAPGDPHANVFGGSHALEYRLVAAKKLGRPLLKYEVVHHVNGDPDDNRPENLEVTTQASHAREHAASRARDPVSGRFLSDGETQ